MEIAYHTNQLFQSVSYSFDSVIVDPSYEWSNFSDVKYILLTHVHFDHISGINIVIELNPNVRIYTNESGREMLLNAKKNLSFYHETPFIISDPSRIVTVKDREEISIAEGMTAKAIFTPGHNPSCITWLIGECLFTGDAYIPGVKTVTNLPDGNKMQAEASLELIKQLSVGKTIYPGHKIDRLKLNEA